jgi:hypothetical protein
MKLSKTFKASPLKQRLKSHLARVSIMETRIVQLRTHQKNIDRYVGLLETKLSEVERQYIEKRLSEERLAMAALPAALE